MDSEISTNPGLISTETTTAVQLDLSETNGQNEAEISVSASKDVPAEEDLSPLRISTSSDPLLVPVTRRGASEPMERGNIEDSQRAASEGDVSATVELDWRAEVVEDLVVEPLIPLVSSPPRKKVEFIDSAARDSDTSDKNMAVEVTVPQLSENIHDANINVNIDRQEDNKTGATKRKASRSASPHEGSADSSEAINSPRSENESVARCRGSLARRRRKQRVLDSDDESDTLPLAERMSSIKDDSKNTSVTRSSTRLSKSKEASINKDSNINVDLTKTRSGKPTADITDISIIVDSDEEINMLDSTVPIIGDTVIRWMTEVDNLRRRSKNMNGSVSGRMKDLITRSMDALTTMLGRYEPTMDAVFLRRRNKEISANAKATENENLRLKKELENLKAGQRVSRVSRATQTEWSPSDTIIADKNDNTYLADGESSDGGRSVSTTPADNTIQPPLPQRIRRLPNAGRPAAPAPPRSPSTSADEGGAEFSRDFALCINRFDGLREQMMQQVETMTRMVNECKETARRASSGKKTEATAAPPKTGKPRIVSDVMLQTPVIIKDGNLKQDSGSETSTWAVVTARSGRKKKKISENSKITDLPGGTSMKKSGGAGPSAAKMSGDPGPPAANIGSKISAAIPKRRRKPSAAVLITGKDKEFSYAEALRKARGKICLKDIGIDSTKMRRAINGGLLIEIPGPEGTEKADALARKLNQILDNAEIRRPIKKASIKLFGLDESTTAEDIRLILAEESTAKSDTMRVSNIVKMSNGLGVAWVELPVEPALALAKLKFIRMGWTSVRIELLKERPMQCFKCWQFGHTRPNCKSEKDRSKDCFKCGKSGHAAKDCKNKISCAVCQENGHEHSHRIGSIMCQSVGEIYKAPDAGKKPDSGPKTA